jgi:ribonuclease P protein component
MLPQLNRLPSSDVPLVMRRGKRTTGDTLTVTALKREAHVSTFVPQSGTPPAESRFAFIVSTKIDKRATRRNRIRRTLRESVHHLLDRITPGFDCILTSRRDVSEMKQPDIEKIVVPLLVKAGILNTEYGIMNTEK